MSQRRGQGFDSVHGIFCIRERENNRSAKAQCRLVRGLPFHAAYHLRSRFDVLPVCALGHGSPLSEVSSLASSPLRGIRNPHGRKGRSKIISAQRVPGKSKSVSWNRVTSVTARLFRVEQDDPCLREEFMLLKVLGAGAILLFVV